MARSPEELRRIANNEKTLVDHIPLSSEITSGVIKLTGNNGFLSTFEIEGVDFETCGPEQIDLYSQQLHQFVLGFGGGAFAFWQHRCHMRVSESLQDNFSNDFSRKLAQQYKERLAVTRLMRTTLYLTVIYRPGELATFKSTGFSSTQEIAAWEREGIEQMEDVAAQVASTLKKFKPRRLERFMRPPRPLARRDYRSLLEPQTQGESATEAQNSSQTPEVIGTECSELMAFMGFLVNGFWEDSHVTNKRLCNILPSTRLTAGDRSGVLQLVMPERVRYVSCLDIKEYPEKLNPVSMGQLLYADQEFIETQSFSILNSRTAVSRLKTQRGQLNAGGEASKGEVADFEQAIEDTRSGRLVFGEYHYNISVFSDSFEDIKKDRASIKAALDDAGFTAVVQTAIPEANWFHQVPGNWKFRTREALLTSWNFVCLSPLHNFMAGKKTGNPWGEAVCIFDSPSGQPFAFNFHCSPEDHDSTDDKLPGNTCIFGATGVGKTTLEMFLIAHLNKYEARVMVLDMDRSTEIAMRRMGATYRTYARGVPTGWNPFQWPDTPSNRAFCRAVVTQCVTRGVEPLGADDEVRLSLAVDTVFGMRLDTRRLALVAQVLPSRGDNSLQARLRRWVGDGDLAWVLDNPGDTLNLQEGRLFGFDYSDFIDDPEVCPVFTMGLLRMFQNMKDGLPLALLMEEFWKPLQSPVFTAFVRNELKTIRKEDGIVILTTQQPDDVLATPLAKTAVQQMVTGIYLPNPNAYHEDYVGGFGLTEQEFETVRSLPVDSRAILVKQDKKSAIVRLDLTGMQDTIAVLSGDLETVAILDEIRAQVGDDPKDWEHIFLGSVAHKRRLKKDKAAGRPSQAAARRNTTDQTGKEI
jgi:type IV secretion system protein VirB4